MEKLYSLTQSELPEFLLQTAIVRPVFIWGPPGIGKSALVTQFAEKIGEDCVSLLGSQLAPEDLIGVPHIEGDTCRFCPPVTLARKEPYVLFLDELNACSSEVQKSMYSLIHEKRLGDFKLHPNTIIIAAGNRAQDSAIVKPLSSALINRMIHIELKVSHRDWLAWAMKEGIHPMVYEYISQRPTELFSPPPKIEIQFSTPRSWHMLSDALKSYKTDVPDKILEVLTAGCLTPSHATEFCGWVKTVRNKYTIDKILKGELDWPSDPKDRSVLYYLAQTFRDQLAKELPSETNKRDYKVNYLVHRSLNALKTLSELNMEIAQLVIASDDSTQRKLPPWFIIEVANVLPRIVPTHPKKY